MEDKGMDDKRVDDTRMADKGIEDKRMEDKRADEAARAPRLEKPVERQTSTALMDHGSVTDFEHRWDSVQAHFVDDPRRAVGEAGTLMADFMEHAAKNLRQRRAELDSARTGDEMDTEAMRLELRRYKELMHQIVADGDGRAESPRMQPATPQPRPAR